jgi:hypothetical protein
MTNIDELNNRLGLSPYQIWVLSQNAYKYDLGGIRKFGRYLYAPYKCNLTRSFADAIKKMLRGPRADLIGPDSMIVSDRRGINIRKMTGDGLSAAIGR